MPYHRLLILLLGVCLLLMSEALTAAQTGPPKPPVTASQLVTTPVLDDVTTRKAEVESQLKSLGESNFTKEELEAKRAAPEQLLEVLTVLEAAIHNRATFLANLDALDKRLEALGKDRKHLESQPSTPFTDVTEQLRDDYEDRLQAIQTEIQALNKEAARGEVRQASIPQELEQRAIDRRQTESSLTVARGKIAKNGADVSTDSIELLMWRLKLLSAETTALEAERDWLSKRGPLQDAALHVAQLRLKNVQRDLQTIKLTLGTVIQHEQIDLSSMAAKLAQQLQQADNPIEVIRLKTMLETVTIRQAMADYRGQLNRLGDRLLTQNRRNTKLKRDVDRLKTLVEKYRSGEVIAQRLLATFEQLRRERLLYTDAPIKAQEARLQYLTGRMFALDDQLYEFDQAVEVRIGEAVTELEEVSPRQLGADLPIIRKALEDQKAALREQQQVLASLVQDQTKLSSLARDYKRQVDEGYLFVLTQMFWLRNAKPLNVVALHEMVVGAVGLAKRLRAFVQAMLGPAMARPGDRITLWLLVPLLVVVLPWGVWRAHRHLRLLQSADLAVSAEQNRTPRFSTTMFMLVQVALWPIYLAVLAWMLGYFLPQIPRHQVLTQTLVQALQLGSLIIGLGILGYTIFLPNGWGHCCWQITPELGRHLRLTILAGSLVTLTLLMPRHILLAAPGEGLEAVGSLALARLFFLLFQSVLFILIALIGRRSSLLMSAILSNSRERDGVAWRIWPVVHLLALAALLGIIVLNILGYQYAARFIWQRAFASLSVVLILRLLLVMIILRFIHWLVLYMFSIGGRLQHRYTDVQETAERYFGVLRTVGHVLLALLSIGLILELWGVSVRWFLASPLTWQVLTRATLIVLIVGLTLAVLQISSVFTDYLIRPKTSVQGVVREPSRKLKTLAPLIQTLIKVGAVFVVILVVLEQVNIATSPILTGVGILGLAIGFASQSLIKDVINGLFLLFEDSLSVGDVVNLRGIGGAVEKVTLRAVTIRDLSGNVHIIPNSTLDMITNMTKDYSRYILDVGVAYRENVDEVIGILREIDEGMRQEPDYRWDILEPLEVMGLDRFEDSAVIIRTRLKTRPGQQWRIGREFKLRMKAIFDERGIQIPFPHRTLYWGAVKTPQQDPLQQALEPHPLSDENN